MRIIKSFTLLNNFAKGKIAACPVKFVLQPFNRIKQHFTGFTLVELLVVVIIITILAVTAIPHTFRVIRRARDAALKSDMKEIQAIAAMMRLEGKNLVGVNCEVGTDPALIAVCRSINDNSPGSTLSFSGPRHFCIQAPLHDGRFWRVDQTGFVGEDICGYVARWDMNENPAIHGTRIHDRTGVNHGTLSTNDGATNKAVAGALTFDGVNDGVDCGNSPILNFTTEDFTIEAWVRATVIPGIHRTIFARGLWNVDGYILAIHMNGNIMLLTNQTGTSQNVNSPAGSIAPGIWYHVVAVRRGTVGIAYINGIESGTGTLANPLTTTRNAMIGNKPIQNWLFNGLIDEVRIYNRALTADEVLSSFRRDCRRLRPDLCP